MIVGKVVALIDILSTVTAIVLIQFSLAVNLRLSWLFMVYKTSIIFFQYPKLQYMRFTTWPSGPLLHLHRDNGSAGLVEAKFGKNSLVCFD